jgi:predicted nuclease with TOPRIM domain
VQGEGNIKYTYNNGIIASDAKLASMNFLNALEKLPGYIEQEQKKIKELKKDLPILQEIVKGTWTKESRLSELKTELASIDRKIQLSITPENKELQTEAVKEQSSVSNTSETIAVTKCYNLSR